MSTVGYFARKSLKTKLKVSMVLIGLLPLVLAATIMNWRTDAALQEQTVAKVDSIAAAKQLQIEQYFATIANQIQHMARDESVVSAMEGFTDAFFELGAADTSVRGGDERLQDYYQNIFAAKFKQETGESIDGKELMPTSRYGRAAQALYIADNPNPLGSKDELLRANDFSAYSMLHSQYHGTFSDFQRRFGYYDLFLVEPEEGMVVYSVFKEVDYATSLTEGHYADSTLAKAFKQARELEAGQSIIVDFEPYQPSYNAPASFIAAPIYNVDTLVGVLVYQMPVDEINSMMGQAKGMGETGQAFLFAQDSLMRSQARLSESPTILQQAVSKDAVSALSAGNQQSGAFTDYAGNSVIASYSKLDIDGLDWGMAVEVGEDEALAVISELHMINGILVVLTIALVSVGAIWFSTKLSQRVKNVVNVANAIASGNFNHKINDAQGDEIQDLNRAMQRMQTELFGQMREKEASMSRIKVALDNADANVMVADNENTIIYINKALEKTLHQIEQSLRTAIPGFQVNGLVGKSMDEFHSNPGHQRNLVTNLREPHQAEFMVGDVTLSVSARPIIDEQGERLGTVTEWRDLTAQRKTEKDLERIIHSATVGDLGQRLPLNSYQGFYLEMARGLNETLDAVEKPIRETRRVMEALADGDLTQRFSGDFQGEFKLLGEAVDASTLHLGEVVTQLQGAVESLTSLSQSLTVSNNELHDRTNNQAGSLQETAAAMDEITGTVTHNTQNARDANQHTEEAVGQAEQGHEVVSAAIESIRQVNESSEEIASITDLINEIAFQTNLLALNAAVEAARAGEQGRGFAVVASEVRALAGRSAEAAKQIETLIKDSIAKISRGTEQVNLTGNALQGIVQSISRVSSTVSEISTASEEQAVGIEEINQAVVQLESVTQTNLDMVAQISEVSKNLERQASDIRETIAAFKTAPTTRSSHQWAPSSHFEEEFMDA